MNIIKRALTRPDEMRALAHPTRMRILEELAEHDEATATELAEWTGELPANCSWHLRQLAKYGFVAESDNRRGRRRPWRLVRQMLSWEAGESADVAAAAGELTSVLQEEEFAALRAWQVRSHVERSPWREAANVSQSSGWLTAEELTAFNAELSTLMQRYVHRLHDPSSRPPDARRVRMFAWAYPTGEWRH